MKRFKHLVFASTFIVLLTRPHFATCSTISTTFQHITTDIPTVSGFRNIVTAEYFLRCGILCAQFSNCVTFTFDLKSRMCDLSPEVSHSEQEDVHLYIKQGKIECIMQFCKIEKILHLFCSCYCNFGKKNYSRHYR